MSQVIQPIPCVSVPVAPVVRVNAVQGVVQKGTSATSDVNGKSAYVDPSRSRGVASAGVKSWASIAAIGTTEAVGPVATKGAQVDFGWFTGLEVAWPTAHKRGKEFVWLPASIQYDPLCGGRNYLHHRAFHHLCVQLNVNPLRDAFQDGKEPSPFVFRLAPGGGVEVDCVVYLHHHEAEAEFLIGDADTLEALRRLMESADLDDVLRLRGAGAASGGDGSSRKLSSDGSAEEEPEFTGRSLGEASGRQQGARARAGRSREPVFKVVSLASGVLEAAVDVNDLVLLAGKVQKEKYCSVRQLASGQEEGSYISLAFFEKLRGKSSMNLEFVSGKKPFGVNFAVKKGKSSVQRFWVICSVDVRGEYIKEGQCDLLLGTSVAESFQQVLGDVWDSGSGSSDERRHSKKDEAGSGKARGGKSESRSSGHDSGRGDSGRAGGRHGSGGGGDDSGDDSDDDGGDAGSASDREDSGDGRSSSEDSESDSEVEVRTKKVLASDRRRGLSKSGLPWGVSIKRMRDVLYYAPTTCKPDRADYTRGINKAVSEEFRTPLVRHGFTTKRRLSKRHYLTKCPREAGMTKASMSKLLLRRIVELAVPDLGSGVDLSGEEGKLCATLFRRMIPLASTFEDQFNNAEGAEIFAIGTDGDWNRIVGWYLNIFNNVNVEDAQVSLALECRQKRSETVEDWILRMNTLLTAVPREVKDKRIARELGMLLQPGWVQNNMQTYVSNELTKIGGELTYAGYMQKAASMAPGDPDRLAAAKLAARGLITIRTDRPQGDRRMVDQRVGGLRSRFKRTREERAAFAQVQAVVVREEAAGGIVCRKCHLTGHVAADCRGKEPRRQQQQQQPQQQQQQPQQQQQQPHQKQPAQGVQQQNGSSAASVSKEVRKCYVCGDERHEARACPNRGAAAHGGRGPR